MIRLIVKYDVQCCLFPLFVAVFLPHFLYSFLSKIVYFLFFLSKKTRMRMEVKIKLEVETEMDLNSIRRAQLEICCCWSSSSSSLSSNVLHTDSV